ncbi:unnamed protein product [Menidia menidia]|uniref:(Atlantic silverside) hypothetical protein n=1 Tax=Menidia menidia TaxID=238744 RepID=A0A8S4BEX4_9TELE|nr:unnamed protein product [Menidia menidia]
MDQKKEQFKLESGGWRWASVSRMWARRGDAAGLLDDVRDTECQGMRPAACNETLSPCSPLSKQEESDITQLKESTYLVVSSVCFLGFKVSRIIGNQKSENTEGTQTFRSQKHRKCGYMNMSSYPGGGMWSGSGLKE